ncbi:hypothetical protein IF1G_10220 [Cordyceps javanica]|uniref:Uncharacterized protein n=1 Tax=Cordyceps javanica TaxID=43265 RepID=A0A545UNE6_9HYPO|nr:hypothetical protein IF1G_10220 [Cordyceps javanica]
MCGSDSEGSSAGWEDHLKTKSLGTETPKLNLALCQAGAESTESRCIDARRALSSCPMPTVPTPAVLPDCQSKGGWWLMISRFMIFYDDRQRGGVSEHTPNNRNRRHSVSTSVQIILQVQEIAPRRHA